MTENHMKSQKVRQRLSKYPEISWNLSKKSRKITQSSMNFKKIAVNWYTNSAIICTSDINDVRRCSVWCLQDFVSLHDTSNLIEQDDRKRIQPGLDLSKYVEVVSKNFLLWHEAYIKFSVPIVEFSGHNDLRLRRGIRSKWLHTQLDDRFLRNSSTRADSTSWMNLRVFWSTFMIFVSKPGYLVFRIRYSSSSRKSMWVVQ